MRGAAKSDGFRVESGARGDYSAVCRLLDLLDDVHRCRVPWLFRDTDGQPRTRDEYRALIADPDSTVLVARSAPAAVSDAAAAEARAEAPDVIGVVLALVRSTPDFPVFVPARFGVIDNLVVAPECRRLGIGRALSDAAAVWAKSRGAAWIELGVYEFNEEARRFYEALGYQTLTRKLVKPLPGTG